MFEIYQLEQLLAFAECGTLSGAAERLHLSQPALSRSMQRLEAELQVSLFDRQKNKIAFNENGRMAAECARQVMEKCRDMVLRVQAFDRSRRTILIGSCAPMPIWELLPLLSDLYPSWTISSEMRENEVLPWRSLGSPASNMGRSTCTSPCRRRIRSLEAMGSI